MRAGHLARISTRGRLRPPVREPRAGAVRSSWALWERARALLRLGLLRL